MINIIDRHGILDVSHTLEMTICVVNQLKNNTIVRDCSMKKLKMAWITCC